MDLKAKLAAAVQRANEDPKGKYTKTITSKPQPQKPTTTNGKSVEYPKMQSRMTKTPKTKGTMSFMPTLRPTSVSVSAEKRTAAPLAGQSTMGKTKRRG